MTMRTSSYNRERRRTKQHYSSCAASTHACLSTAPSPMAGSHETAHPASTGLGVAREVCVMSSAHVSFSGGMAAAEHEK